MSTRIARLIVAILGGATSVALSWPYWRDFAYWATSHSMWFFYFVVGFVLTVYIFHVYLGSLGTLFEHAALERKEAQARKASSDKTSTNQGDTP